MRKSGIFYRNLRPGQGKLETRAIGHTTGGQGARAAGEGGQGHAEGCGHDKQSVHHMSQ